jgi:hypothetical protein
MPFSRSRVLAVLGLAAAAGAFGCERSGEDRVLAIVGTSAVIGNVYFDSNGNRILDAGDFPFPTVGLRLVARGTRDTVAKTTSNRAGAYALFGLAPGEYLLVVDTTGLGDTVRVVGSGAPEIRLRPFDSLTVQIGVSYPTLTVAQLRGLLPGRRAFVEAVAMNGPALFGDSTVHVADASAAIRATRVRQNLTAFGAGDSLRLLGRRSNRAAQPTLDDVSVTSLGLGVGPATETIATADAATARAGALDARLVRIAGANVISTLAGSQGDFDVMVTDGSGALTITLDAEAGLSTAGLAPGAVIDAVGVLVPTGAGDFRLKPRVNADVVRH